MLLVNALLVVLSSQSVWTRKSEPSLDEAHAGLFRGSDKYDFALEVPAAGMDCFWHFAHQSGSFYLTYMVQWVTGMANDHRLFVTVSSPDGVLMASTNNAVGLINFQTEVTGFYRICLGNHNNQFGGIRVFVNFGVIYEGSEESETEAKEGEKVLNNTLAGIEISSSIPLQSSRLRHWDSSPSLMIISGGHKIRISVTSLSKLWTGNGPVEEESVQKLQNQIFHIWRHYNFARMRRGKDHYLLLSNFNYVTWWSATQSLVILLSGYLQLLVLKRLFHTDSSRPRC